MPDINLIPYKTGPYIIAPDFCPYKVSEDVDIFIVHSNFCPLCKKCNFTQFLLNLKTQEFINYLTLINTEISSSLQRQLSYLRKQNRIPLSILISAEVFESMLKLVYEGDTTGYTNVKSYFLNNELPICYLAGCPTYFSRKLTKSKIMVIGEVIWK